MASRGHYSHSHDWDPMKEDYDETYDPQYPDDDESGGVQLHHCKLYVTNIIKAINEEGLRSAFAVYGTLVHVHLSRDPSKRYAIITYETPSEAKLAMMKLNRTEPLRLHISIAHKKNYQDKQGKYNKYGAETTTYQNGRGNNSYRGRNSVKHEDLNGSNENDAVNHENNTDFIEDINTDDMQQLQMEYLKIQEEEIQCRKRILMWKIQNNTQKPAIKRSILPDGRIVVRKSCERENEPSSFDSAAGDSRALKSCSCGPRTWNDTGTSGSSTASTCVHCSEEKSVTGTINKDKSAVKYMESPIKYVQSVSTITRSVDLSKTDKKSEYSRLSKTTEVTKSILSNSDYCKISETITKQSDVTSKRVNRLARKSDITYVFNYSDFYSDNDDEADETNRLIQLRNADYMDIVDEHLKIVVALSGYPKSKMRLKQMEHFQRSLNGVIDMQLKAGFMKKTPSFIDYYLNRDAIVCICKDIDSRDWLIRITPGLEERMCTNLTLLKAKAKRLCLAVIKIPKSCWPATAEDAFKLLQYFNPTLKTHLWKIYSQKIVEDVVTTSFLVDRVSVEIIRGPNFKNVIDYNQMEFELMGYIETYNECYLLDMDEDLSSVASRVKLLEELKSNDITPRNKPETSDENSEQQVLNEKLDSNIQIDVTNTSEGTNKTAQNKVNDKDGEDKEDIVPSKTNKNSDDVKIGDETNEVLCHTNDNDCNKHKAVEVNESEAELNEASTSAIAVSERTESVIESSENVIIGWNRNLNIDSNRGTAYYRRTNYLHVENELKVAIVLEGYPQNKLEGTHIRRLKHLFKDYLHKDMKLQRFANLIIPKFQDIYLSNGAVIYICDSLETKDYLTEILPKFITSTGLKLIFRDIRNLVRYTRIVMRLPKELAHVESRDILLQLQNKYTKLKPDCWKYYSDVAGKQKRQYGVDPESLEVIKSPDFEPIYDDEKLSFRIIDRQKPDANFEEGNVMEDNTESENIEAKRLRDRILKTMYCLIEPDIMKAPLTKIRANHYSDLIADDLKLYVGPTNYPETRIDEGVFFSIKKSIENIVFEAIDSGRDEFIPTFHDLYLFDGVIFVICQDMPSRLWIEKNITKVGSKLLRDLKATEFRGAVGIINMVVKTDKATDEVISILQKQNPRLRTKYWRTISTVKSRVKLDVVLQIDKLSAQVITGSDFNGRIGDNIIEFKLGHLKSLLKPKLSLEVLRTAYAKKYNKVELETKNKSSVLDKNLVAECSNGAINKVEVKEESEPSCGGSKVFLYNRSKYKSGERDSLRSFNIDNNQDFTKLILKVPTNILPDLKDGLGIIFDLLEDKNPGLNTELWKVLKQSQYNKGKFHVLVDKQSSSIIKVPGLQGASSRLCLTCGAHADAYCTHCGLAPYCNARCQRIDWMRRHRTVCHNLARINDAPCDLKDKDTESKVSAIPRDYKKTEIDTVSHPPAPLRRLRSPAPVAANRDAADRSKKNVYPTGKNNSEAVANKAKNYRTGQSFKNQNFRRPMKQNEANDNEESLEPNVGSNSLPVIPSPILNKPIENPSNEGTRAPLKQSPVKKEPVLSKVDTVPEVKKIVQPGSVTDVMPGRVIIPKQYLIETLSIGETVLLSVDAKTSDCASKSNGYVCLSLHESSEENYKLLCEDYTVDCETALDCKPNPGELFSYRNPEDGAYYRARCLNPSSAALIDCSKLVSLSPNDKCKKIAPKYEAIAEFCCIVDAPNIKIEDNLQCTLKSKTANGIKVQLKHMETGADIGPGEVSRWRALVDCPVPKLLTAALVIPEVPRPDVKNKSTVLLVEASSLDRVLVRPSDVDSIRMFDSVLYDVLQVGMKASPIKEPPQKGHTVIGRFSDGNCYRALCRRTNVQHNKYQLEYIEFGNIEINTRETIYECPPHLDLASKPTLVSVVKLPLTTKGLTAAATEYIEKLRDTSTELVLTLPDGVSSAPSGADVELTVAKNRESVNKKIEVMCTPEWKKIADRGGDVVEVQPLMIGDLEYMELPSGACEVEVLDVSMLRNGAVSGCRRQPGTAAALEALTKQIEEYCNSELGRKPYLPICEELCIAQLPPYPQWFRAVLCEQVGGAGGAHVRVCYLDYGNVETVPVTVLRKMLPEFVHGHPALASHIEIRGFPENPDDHMLAKALQHMKIDDEGQGFLQVARCEKVDSGLYMVDAPELLKAMGVCQ